MLGDLHSQQLGDPPNEPLLIVVIPAEAGLHIKNLYRHQLRRKTSTKVIEHRFNFVSWVPLILPLMFAATNLSTTRVQLPGAGAPAASGQQWSSSYLN